MFPLQKMTGDITIVTRISRVLVLKHRSPRHVTRHELFIFLSVCLFIHDLQCRKKWRVITAQVLTLVLYKRKSTDSCILLFCDWLPQALSTFISYLFIYLRCSWFTYGSFKTVWLTHTTQCRVIQKWITYLRGFDRKTCHSLGNYPDIWQLLRAKE
jgi:hypothetical protein